MARRNRPAFTLVEMLVVIVIISMLVGMLMPAINRGRGRAQQTQCTNNQHNLALAVQHYESSVGRFPGYINKMGTGAINASNRQMPLSWMTVLLPYLEREDLWREWRTELASAALVPPRVVRLPQAICPSDTAKRDDVASLSYVANCGIEDRTQNDLARGGARDESASDGVFFNLYGYAVSGTWYPATSVRITASDMKDGSSNTLMLSENMQARTWHADTSLASEKMDEPYLGFVWRRRSDGTNSGTAGDTLQINQNKSETPAITLPNFYAYARPSSQHPGGVVAAYCDGSVKFLSQAIQYDTLRHLMTPNSREALNATFAGDNELRD